MSSPSLTQEYNSEYNSNNTNINDEFTYIILSPNVTVRKISEEDILKIYGYDGDDVDDKPKQKTKKWKSKKRKSKKPVIDITEAKDNEIIKIADEPVILDEDDSNIDTNNSNEETTNQEDATMYTQQPLIRTQPTDNDLHNLSINDGYFNVLERFRNISHIISVVKDTVYQEFTRIIVTGQQINPCMNRDIFLLSGFSQTSLGIIREINSNGLTNRKYFYVNRLHSIEDLLRPIINTYALLLDRKMNDPSRANIYPYYIQLKSPISDNRFNIDIELANDIECSKYDCPICLNIKKPETKCTTSCSHDFCGDCIISHIDHTELLNNVCCPLCRQHIKSITISTYNQLSRLSSCCK